MTARTSKVAPLKILVIGRSGQVARSMAARAPDDHTLMFAGRPSVDLTNPDSLRSAVNDSGADLVINAAAYTAVDAAEDDEGAAWQANAVAPGVLAQACAAAGIKLIHISTDFVFDGTAGRPYREADATNPQSVYGRSKAAGEAAVLAAEGASVTVRTAWVYSPFGKNFVKTIMRLCAERDHLRVVADQRGNPTSALDLADALFSLADQHDVWPGSPSLLHLAGSGSTTWHGLAQVIGDQLQRRPVIEPIATHEYPTPAQRPADSRLDGTLARTDFGIALPDWRGSVRDTIERLSNDEAG
ncbi:MAG: dTDP-4-dehydrorhamnose reductase [Pseudomonadota bacterium]